MSYYQRFRITSDNKESVFQKELLDFIHENDPDIVMDENGVLSESLNWRGYRRYMLELSQKYPNELFTVKAIWEYLEEDLFDEWDDHWLTIGYFKNGKYKIYAAKIIYPEYDEEDMHLPYIVDGEIRSIF